MILFFSFIISVFLNFIIFFLFRADCLRSSCTRTAGGQKPLFPLKKPSGSIFAAPVQNAEQQKRHQQVPDKAVCGPVARLQDQEAEKQRKQHVQHAKLQGPIGDLRDQSEDEKTQGVIFSGMGIAVALHQKEAHRHRRKVSFSSGMIGFLLFQAF